jgi:hypothetical protein
LILWALIVAAGMACQVESTAPELTGTWKMTPDAAARVARNERGLDLRPTIVDLRSDGTFVGQRLPCQKVSTRSGDDAGVYDATGRWILGARNGRPIVELSLTSVSNTACRITLPTTDLQIYRTRFDFYLYDNFDPDAGPEMVYRR